LFVALALHTGARTGALLGLTWESVDLSRRTIDLGLARGKKRRARHLPINDTLLSLLTEAYQVRTSAWVVEYRSAQVASIRGGFRAACRRADLAGVTPHVLRHTAVTWMMQSGVPTTMIGKYAAMSSAMVEERYGHHSPNWLRQASEALGGFSRPNGRENESETIKN
jgi:integrase